MIYIPRFAMNVASIINWMHYLHGSAFCCISEDCQAFYSTYFWFFNAVQQVCSIKPCYGDAMPVPKYLRIRQAVPTRELGDAGISEPGIAKRIAIHCSRCQKVLLISRSSYYIWKEIFQEDLYGRSIAWNIRALSCRFRLFGVMENS